MDYVFPVKFETPEFGSQDDGRLTALNPLEDTIPLFGTIPLVIDETLAQIRSKLIQQGIGANAAKDLVFFDRNAGAIELGKLSRGEYLPLASAIGLSTASTNSQGTATTFCKSDHSHLIAKGTPIQILPDVAIGEGTSNGFARADHVHNIPTDVATTSATNIVNSKGTANSFSRSDHKHKIELGYYQQATTTQVSTTSSSYQAISAVTMYPQAGTYIAFAKALHDNSSNGSYNYISLLVNNAVVANSDPTVRVTSNRQNPWYSDSIITVDGFMPVTIGFTRSAGTARVWYASLTLLRIA